MKRTLVLFALLCLISVPAFAQKPANYGLVKLGIYSPQATDMEDFSNGFNGELALGHYFTPNVAGEIGIGYFKTDADFAAFDPTLGAITENDKITVYPLTITAKGVLPLPGGELYVGAGLGLYFAKAESDLFIAAFGSESESSDDTAFGGHIVAGGNINVAPNIFLGAEMKYIWVKPSFNATFFGVPVSLDAKLDGFIATGNLGFRF